MISLDSSIDRLFMVPWLTAQGWAFAEAFPPLALSHEPELIDYEWHMSHAPGREPAEAFPPLDLSHEPFMIDNLMA